MIGVSPQAPAGSAAREERAPVLRSDLVYRAGVVNRLRVERAPVLFLTAPPGYGKTSALAQWAGRETREFRWLRLEPGDDEPRALPSLFADVLGVDGPARGAVTRVRAALEARVEPLVIVIDNGEHLRAPGRWRSSPRSSIISRPRRSSSSPAGMRPRWCSRACAPRAAQPS